AHESATAAATPVAVARSTWANARRASLVPAAGAGECPDEGHDHPNDQQHHASEATTSPYTTQRYTSFFCRSDRHSGLPRRPAGGDARRGGRGRPAQIIGQRFPHELHRFPKRLVVNLLFLSLFLHTGRFLKAR